MNKTVKRITFDSMMLALLCIIGMFSIPLGDNIKVSLQFLMVIIIFGLCDKLLDKLLIVSLYMAIGLFLPVYAGFSAGITPTFGFVIGFVLSAFIFHLLNLIKLNDEVVKFYICSFGALIITYLSGSIFLALYLNKDFVTSLSIGVLPYIPFDIAKIIIAYLIVRRIKTIKRI